MVSSRTMVPGFPAAGWFPPIERANRSAAPTRRPICPAAQPRPAKRSGWRGARNHRQCGSASSNLGQASRSAASSPSSVLPAHQPQTAGDRLQQAGRVGLLCDADIKFEVSGHCDPLRQAADGRSRSASVSALRQHAAEPAQERPPQPAQPPVARPGAVGDAGIHHGHGDSAPVAAAEPDSARTQVSASTEEPWLRAFK